MASDYLKDEMPRLEVESVQIAQDPFAPNAVCTARLKGVKEEFVFGESSGHSIGFSWQCEGMDYPAKPWPQHGSVNFRGPVIDAMFDSKHVSLDCDENGCTPRDRDGRDLREGPRVSRNYLREEFDEIIAIMDKGSHSAVLAARERTISLLLSVKHVCNT
jgi:hypothetical protein